MSNFSDSGHPIFRASSGFERGEMRSKEHGKKSIHFNGSDENIELPSPHGDFCESAQYLRATVDLCNESTEDFRASEKPEAPDHLETMEIPTGPSIAETHANAQQRRKLVQK